MIEIKNLKEITISANDYDRLCDICCFARSYIRAVLGIGTKTIEEKAQALGCKSTAHYVRIENLIEEICK